jgi:hypothetical protein
MRGMSIVGKTVPRILFLAVIVVRAVDSHTWGKMGNDSQMSLENEEDAFDSANTESLKVHTESSQQPRNHTLA